MAKLWEHDDDMDIWDTPLFFRERRTPIFSFGEVRQIHPVR